MYLIQKLVGRSQLHDMGFLVTWQSECTCVIIMAKTQVPYKRRHAGLSLLAVFPGLQGQGQSACPSCLGSVYSKPKADENDDDRTPSSSRRDYEIGLRI